MALGQALQELRLQGSAPDGEERLTGKGPRVSELLFVLHIRVANNKIMFTKRTLLKKEKCAITILEKH